MFRIEELTEDFGGGKVKKKTYERPAIVHTEKLEARATACNKQGAGVPGCETGPIQS